MRYRRPIVVLERYNSAIDKLFYSGIILNKC